MKIIYWAQLKMLNPSREGGQLLLNPVNKELLIFSEELFQRSPEWILFNKEEPSYKIASHLIAI